MAETETVKQLLREASRRLQHLDSARLDAEVLLAEALGSGRESLYGHPERRLAGAAVADFHALVNRRCDGYPVAYLTGRREFWSLEFLVNRNTLIPRPETECLVEAALERIPADAAVDILDLGTGCGAIAVALARERPRCRITATDVSPEALDVARENAARAGVEGIRFLGSDWFADLAGQCFHLIACNPPYVESGDTGFSTGEIRFEPRLALDGGHAGLAALQRIIPAAARHLHPGGQLLLEHGHRQGGAVQRLLQLHRYRDPVTLQDFAGRDRITVAVLP
jgi:release factor glutamine methyltransferase